MPETEDKIVPLFPSISDLFVIHLFYGQGASKKGEKEKNQGGKNMTLEKRLETLIHVWPVSRSLLSSSHLFRETEDHRAFYMVPLFQSADRVFLAGLLSRRRLR